MIPMNRKPLQLGNSVENKDIAEALLRIQIKSRFLQRKNMRAVINPAAQPRTSRVVPLTAKTDWLTLGIVGATFVGEVGGVIQGYPLLAMMHQGDVLMYMSLLGMGMVLMVTIGIIIVASMRRTGAKPCPWTRENKKRSHRHE
eukprot:Protomagalhaensia_sp_Gyna_25__4264@NODE_388_length_3606_cov_47_708719_g298_i0_p3_GENE_NODE_388_length_3606_cov_47_708719_g298_i0NODE_388_length_3606_cov_47_708719_g298_i0_p3_ORF_typecomplete_len143_score0_87COX2_TM/PF02790_15/1e03COX2_TM/PF02790_15/0_32DUF3294/PF07957_11/0_23_NODE_388_length_3606_cov_47_708719_g298_i029973425